MLVRGVPKMQNKQKLNIICLSNQLWDFENWTNKKHVMYRLAKMGHHVLFVDPPTNMGKLLLRQISLGLWNILRIIFQVKKDSCGAYIYTPINVMPFFQVTTLFHLIKIIVLSKIYFDKSLKTVLWVYHVQMYGLEKYLKYLKHDILIYDCVDNYEAFPVRKSLFNPNLFGQKLKDQEKMLAQKANIVFGTAPGLVDKLKRHNNNVYFMPNVGDYERFKDSKNFSNNLPLDIADIPRPRIGFTGALDDYKFDIQLMKQVVSDHPNFSFVIIGQVALSDKNASIQKMGLDKPNVYFLGRKPFEEMYRYYAGFDAYLIPYVLNDYTVGGCFPVKFHEGLAAGVPVIVTDLPAYAPFSNVCYISKNYNEFSNNIQKALDEDNLDKVKARQAVAKENNWDGKVEKMLNLIYKEIGD